MPCRSSRHWARGRTSWRRASTSLYVAPDAASQAKQIEEGLALARAAGDRDFEGRFLHESSDLDFAQGRFASASLKLEEAVDAFEQAGARRDLGRALNSLSRLERTHGQVERAFEVSGRALAIQEELGDQAGALQSLDQMADARSQLGAHAEALALYERALAIARKTESPHLVATIQGRLSRTYLHMGQPARAVELLEGVVARGVTAETGPVWYGQLARAYLGVGRLADGLAAADKALELARGSGVVDRILPALHVRAAALQRLGRRDEALADAREEIAGLERLRSELVPDDFMKRGFADQHQAVFELTIGLLNEEGRHRDALETAEQARARAFLDLLGRRGADARPPRVTARGLGRRGRGDGAAAGLHGPQLFRRRRRALHLGRLRRRDRPGHACGGDRRPGMGARARDPHRAASTRARAGRGAEGRSRAGDARRWAAADGRWRRASLAPARRDPDRAGPRAVAAWSGQPAHDRAARPALPVSFAALRDAQGRYLVEDHALHYAPSAAVLQMTARKARPAGLPGRRVFMADPGRSPKKGAGRCRRCRGRAREVAGQLRAAQGRRKRRAPGAEATEANLRRLAHGRRDLAFRDARDRA